jgi:uncharacterized protein (DUF2147 family)
MSRRAGGGLPSRALALFAAVALAAVAFAETESARSNDVRGLWVDQRDPGKRKVGLWSELCGRIVWLRKPLSGGRPKQDKHNPDVRLRDRPLCGLRILSGFRRAGAGVWNAGQVYNPGDGRTFSSTMTLEGDGGLRIRGYVGAALFGKTVNWVRPQDRLSPCG